MAEFYRNRSTWDGYQCYCTPCWTEFQKESKARRRARGIAVSDRADVRRRYGLSHEQWRELVERANGHCMVCGTIETRTGRNGTTLRLAIDHDHETGVVRGLICYDCNIALGAAREDPERLRSLAEYLERTDAVTPELSPTVMRIGAHPQAGWLRGRMN